MRNNSTGASEGFHHIGFPRSMKRNRSLFHSRFALIVSFGMWTTAFSAETPAALATVKTQRDLESVIATTTGPLRQALQTHASAILSAAAQRAHAQAVIETIKIGQGRTEQTNNTPASLKQIAGGDLAVFDTLRLVDLSIPNAGPHDHRKVDPYDAAFFEHLGHIQTLETLNIIATKLSDEWIAPLGKLTNLKMLRLVNNGKLTDVGMEKLAGLKNLEQFSFVGTGMKGHAYAKFEGWTRLVRVSHRGSSIDDEGLRQLCEHLPNLENISLAHAKFTDAGAVHLNKLTKLKGLEIGTRNATPAALKHIAVLPLEYLQLGDGLDASAGIAAIRGIKTLKRLTLTDCKLTTDGDLKIVAAMKHLENLELSNIPFPESRLPLLKEFAHLKALRLVPANRIPFSPDTQAAVKKLLPSTALKFE